MPRNTKALAYHDHIALSVLIGQRVRALREERGWRQLDLAHRLALVGFPWPQTAIATVESGERQLDPEELVAFARVFGLPVGQLLPPEQSDETLSGVRVGRSTLPLAALRWYLSGGGAGNRDADPERRQVDRPDFDVQYADYLREQEEAIRKAARALGVNRETVQRMSRQLWGMSLPRHRDAELDDQLQDEGGSKLTARSRQALRGHITRRLLAEMRAALAKESE